jgi:hypothetical protein
MPVESLKRRQTGLDSSPRARRFLSFSGDPGNRR